MEKGLAGFRLDAIINIKKDLRFQDFPADREDGMCSAALMLQNAQGVHEFLQEMKEKAFAPYHAFTIGELFDFREEEMEKYIGENGCFESIFDFAPHLIGGNQKGWYACEPVDPDAYRDTVMRSKLTSQKTGLMANIIENHDEPRGVSRYIPEGEVTEISKKMLAGLMMMTYGLPFLYQGQEIGMTNTHFESISDINDISTIEEYRLAREQGFDEREALDIVAKFSRDNARTPMQWDDTEHAGFTDGTPWLKENPNYKEINVEQALADKDGIWYFYKNLNAFRIGNEVIRYGSYKQYYPKDKHVWTYEREYNGKKYVVIANYSDREVQFVVPEELKDKESKYVMGNYGDSPKTLTNTVLRPYEAMAYEL